MERAQWRWGVCRIGGADSRPRASISDLASFQVIPNSRLGLSLGGENLKLFLTL